MTLCLCMWRKLWPRGRVIEKAEAEEGRQVEISVVEKGSEALREMNLVGDSVS